MKNRNVYWLCQILGWGGYSLVGVAGNGFDKPPVTIGYALYFLYSIALTHGLRAYSHRKGWLDGAQGPERARLFLAAWIVGLVQAVLVIGINIALAGSGSPFLTAAVLIPAFFGISAVPLGWMTLYLAITSTRRAREKLLALRDAELRALELQINPHFLFNALNSIRGLVIENPPLAQDLITRLAGILRYNLHRDASHTVPLASELESAADYLALEQARYEDRLRIHYAVAPETGAVPVPPMLLQTLVENAIKHGIGRLPEGGDLRIAAGRENGSLLVSVENPGQLGEPPGTACGLGLQNLRDRLRILYGPRAKLDLAACNGTVTAAVRIPIES